MAKSVINIETPCKTCVHNTGLIYELIICCEILGRGVLESNKFCRCDSYKLDKTKEI